MTKNHKMNKKTFTKYFNVCQTPLDFLDIPLDKDIEVFICPFLIENTKLENKFSLEVYDRLVSFLSKLNKEFVMPNKKALGISFLSHLHEPNEIHFGYSKRSKGKAIAKEKATVIFEALRNNSFAKQGIHTTNEAHNVLLLVKGIGQDIMSDFILNVCRDIFSKFTAKQMIKNNITNTKSFQCEFYNDNSTKWEKERYILPVYQEGKIILVPKNIVSGKRAYSTRYNWFIARNHIAIEIINKKVTLKNDEHFFKKLKNGAKKIIIKKIYEAYKKPKEDLIQFVLDYPGSLDSFVQYAKEHYPEIDLNNLDL